MPGQAAQAVEVTGRLARSSRLPAGCPSLNLTEPTLCTGGGSQDVRSRVRRPTLGAGLSLPPVASAVYPSLESDEDSPVFKSRSKKRKASDDAPYSPTGRAGGRALSTPRTAMACGRSAGEGCPCLCSCTGASWWGEPELLAPDGSQEGAPGPRSTCPPPALPPCWVGWPTPLGLSLTAPPLPPPPELVRCPWTQEQAGLGGSRGARRAGCPLRLADPLSHSEGWPIGAEAGQACSRGDQSGLHRDRAGGRCSQAVPAGEEGPA